MSATGEEGHLPMLVIVPNNQDIPTVGPILVGDGFAYQGAHDLAVELGLKVGEYSIRELVPADDLFANLAKWEAIRDGRD